MSESYVLRRMLDNSVHVNFRMLDKSCITTDHVGHSVKHVSPHVGQCVCMSESNVLRCMLDILAHVNFRMLDMCVHVGIQCITPHVGHFSSC